MIAYLKLWGDLALADPLFLVLLGLLPFLWAWRMSRRVRPALPWGGIEGRGRVPAGPRARLIGLPPTLEAAGVGLLVLALARPQKIQERVDIQSRGVDIVLCLDVSSSMELPLDDPGAEKKKSRLACIKEVAVRFVRGRKGDRVGVVTFARFPRVLCPPTLDLEAVEGFLKSIQAVRVREEDGTGIGAGLARAVALLAKSKARSRVVVLLTDGQENIHEIEPLEAGRAAEKFKVRVHTVAAVRYVYFRGPFGGVFKQEQELDTRDLEEIARMTGGRFFPARDRKALEKVWSDIDKMEKTKFKGRRWVDARDVGAPLLAWGIILVFLGLLSAVFYPGGLP